MVDHNRLTACHWLLLRLAGWMPDGLVAQCRTWLANGRELDVGRAIAFALLLHRTSLSEVDLDLLGELLVEAGADSSMLDLVQVADDDVMPMYGFVADREDAMAAILAGSDLAGSDPDDGSPEAHPGWRSTETEVVAGDDVDAQAVAVAEGSPAVIALWRAWRFPCDGAPWPPPRRVFVAETAAADLVAVTELLQQALLSAGETDPQVEVYPTGAVLPAYQRLARAYGALLWARRPDPGVRVAALSGPGYLATEAMQRPHVPHIDDDERDQLLGYLRRGEAMLETEARTDDVMDQQRGAVVPMSFRTDGYFIWTDAATYYLAEYGMGPDPELVAHIQKRGYHCPDVDGAGLYRALAALQEWSGV